MGSILYFWDIQRFSGVKCPGIMQESLWSRIQRSKGGSIKVTTSTQELPSAPNSPRARKVPWVTISYYLAFVVLGMTGASLGPTLPGLAQQTHSDISQISFLFTARLLGYLLGSLFAGPIYDRRPGHPILAGALLLMAAMLVLTPLVPLLWLLAVALLLLGLGEGTLNVGGNTLLVWIHGDDVGPLMNGLHFIFGIGSFLAPVIVAQVLLLNGGISWSYWILALLTLPVALWILRLESPPRRNVPAAGRPAGENHWLIGLMTLFFFLHVGATVSFAGWLFTYAVTLHVATEAMAAYLTSAFWAAVTVGRLINIPLAARARPSHILLGDMIGVLASLAVLLVWSRAPIVLWGGTFGVGLFMASLYPISICVMQRRMTLTAAVAGLVFAGGSAGGMVLPWLIGQLFEPVGPQVTMVVILAAMAMGLLVLAAILSLAPPQPSAACVDCDQMQAAGQAVEREVDIGEVDAI